MRSGDVDDAFIHTKALSDKASMLLCCHLNISIFPKNCNAINAYQDTSLFRSLQDEFGALDAGNQSQVSLAWD
jgi:hypothetical protein